MSLEGADVVVVGAGIGGIAAALLAARAGARVTVFEEADEPRAVGAGLLLQPNGLAVLFGLDLDERLMRRGVRVSSLRIADETGATILETPVPRFGEGLDHALVLPRGELLAALVDLLVVEPNVTCRFGAHVTEVSPDGRVVFHARSGDGTTSGDVIVGADGVHSTVRKRARIAAKVSRGHRYVRGIGPSVDFDGMTEYWTRLGIFGVAPLRRGCYYYASAQDGPLSSAIRDRDLTLFLESWAAALPLSSRVLADVRRFEDLIVNETIRVDCESWVAGRVVLLGDAAHAMAPNLGQGAGSALVDATVLVWELAQGGDPAAAMARYEARRRPAVHAVQRIADQLGWLSAQTAPVVRTLRDRALRLLGPLLPGNIPMRLVEQADPLWLRMAAANPREALT